MNHVLLVSEQPMPNFLPILNVELRPDTVTLVVSDKMKDRAMWLKTEIEKHQVKILPDISIGSNVSNIAEIQAKLLRWADENSLLMENSALNVTGGTKPMAIAAQEVFRMAGRPVFYVDVSTDSAMWLPQGNEVSNIIHLQKTPTIGQFFGLNGITIVAGDFRSVLPNDKWAHFYSEVASAPQKWASAIRELNRIASEAELNRSLEFSSDEASFRIPEWSELMEMLHVDELVRYKKNGRDEDFCSAEARRFCNGVWLEHYVFEKLKSMGFDKKHALMNVKISDARGNFNELDAVVLHNNICYVIEDKTRNMKRDGVADSAVYKLAQLSSKMGLKARGILVSALDVRSVDEERARAYNVDVIDWLPRIEEEFNRIFKKR
jgi:hypothetical protein